MAGKMPAIRAVQGDCELVYAVFDTLRAKSQLILCLISGMDGTHTNSPYKRWICKDFLIKNVWLFYGIGIFVDYIWHALTLCSVKALINLLTHEEGVAILKEIFIFILNGMLLIVLYDWIPKIFTKVTLEFCIKYYWIRWWLGVVRQ